MKILIRVISCDFVDRFAVLNLTPAILSNLLEGLVFEDSCYVDSKVV